MSWLYSWMNECTVYDFRDSQTYLSASLLPYFLIKSLLRPPVLSAIFFGALTVWFFVRPDQVLPPAGCRRLCTSRTSHLTDQSNEKPKNSVEHPSYTVRALFVYPIKSCYPLEVDSADIEQMGMRFDRKFSFAQLTSSMPEMSSDGQSEVERSWQMITQRSVPFLTKVKTEVWIPDPTLASYDPDGEWAQSNGCILVTFPYSPPVGLNPRGLINLWRVARAVCSCRNLQARPLCHFKVPFDPPLERRRLKGYHCTEPMRIWKDLPEAFNMGNEIPQDVLEKLKLSMGITNPLTLFRVDPEHPREVFRNAPRQEQLGYQPVTGFQDAVSKRMFT